MAQGNSQLTQEIRAVLDKQAADWNRGDLEAFATGYKNSPDILFMGSPIDVAIRPDGEHAITRAIPDAKRWAR